MNITQIVKPPVGAVSLSQVWQHLRVDTEGSPAESPLDDTYERNILTATAEFEKSTRTAVIEQTLRMSVGSSGCDGVRLRMPFQSLVAVSYYDASNVLRSVDLANCYVTDEFPPHLRFVSGYTITLFDRPDALRVDYVAGFAPAGDDYRANVPSEIQDAILLRVELLQANTSPADREALTNAIEHIESGIRVPLSQA
jgi:uncharacterized phiE125 gp8 family phage protein